MRKIGIIGLGNVGATVAYTLLAKGEADHLVLIDLNEQKAEAEYNDLSDALPRVNKHVQITLNDWDALKDAEIVVTAVGKITATAETGDRLAELKINAKNAYAIGEKLQDLDFKGIILNISNPCDVITRILQEASALPAEQVFGTGTFLDTARFQRFVGEKLEIAPKSVLGFVLGEHGSTEFVAWSTVRANNLIASQLFDEDEMQDIEKAPEKDAMSIAKGKGYTSYAIASTCVRLIEAIESDEHLYAPVSTYQDDCECYIGYPAVITRQGAISVKPLSLTRKESGLLFDSADKLKEKYNEVKK
ncbi:MAG: NAD(P)-binding domain-containing protein [Lactobacillus sp.]|nr:NAD(P)-binding domain-containing protein [Lactobacillus sp.]